MEGLGKFYGELALKLALKERQGFIYSTNQCVLNVWNTGIMGRAEIILRAKIRNEKNTEAVHRELSYGEFLTKNCGEESGWLRVIN